MPAHPYRHAESAPDPHKRRRGGSALAAGVMGALVFAIVLVLSSFGDGSSARRWSFTEQGSSVHDLGLATPTELAGAWQLEDHEHATGGRALVNAAGVADGPPALAVSDMRARDVRAATRCKVAADGTACGLVFRFHDAERFYVARADQASREVSLGVVVDGVERRIAHVPSDVSGAWQELAIEARAAELSVTWNGKRVIAVRDATLRDSGKVGLWAPSASVALFDELTVETLPVELHPLELVPVLLKLAS